MAAILAAEDAEAGADDALARLRQADYDVTGTPYEAFIRRYFAG